MPRGDVGHGKRMSVHTMGDTACLVSFDGEIGPALLEKVRAFAARLTADRLEGVTDIVPAYASVAVVYEPERVQTSRGELPWRVVVDWLERHLAGRGPKLSRREKRPREHVIVVAYGGEYGPDLELVAKSARLSVDEVVKLHAGAVYQVAAIGFTPGFPYLAGLPERLSTPRRATPRVRVPAGSVGIGGAQTGIYPSETPGGWQLIGRTNETLFNPHRAGAPSLLAVGDSVRFRAVDKLPEMRADDRPVAPGNASGAGAFVEVLKPGTLTTVQDQGRYGYAALGVGAGGAMDPWAAAAANLAVGNEPGAPLLECTYVGPVLRFSADTVVATVGAETASLPAGRPVVVRAGEVVDCSVLARGARLYLAVAGGFRVPTVLGGGATSVKARFGGLDGRALAKGDCLEIAAPETPPRSSGWRVAPPVPPPRRKDVVEVRLIRGVDWTQIFRRHGPGGDVRAVESRSFQLSGKSDRMGLRLACEQPFSLPGGSGEQVSRPVVPGTVQLPPDGQPIVLMAEGQTIGGYPQLGQVASVDLAKLAQARPGAEIRFVLSDVSTAQQARLRVTSDLARLRVGLEMRR